MARLEAAVGKSQVNKRGIWRPWLHPSPSLIGAGAAVAWHIIYPTHFKAVAAARHLYPQTRVQVIVQTVQAGSYMDLAARTSKLQERLPSLLFFFRHMCLCQFSFCAFPCPLCLLFVFGKIRPAFPVIDGPFGHCF